MGADPLPEGGDDVREFAIECRIVDATGRQEQIETCPKVTVFEHQAASIKNLTSRPFVVAVRDKGKEAAEPIIEVLDEGWTFDLCCHGNGRGKCTLDVTICELAIAGVEVAAVNAQTSVQQPRQDVTKRRHFVAAADGERLTIALDGKPAGKSRRYAELIVREQFNDGK
jgi:hypothetical protein